MLSIRDETTATTLFPHAEATNGYLTHGRSFKRKVKTIQWLIICIQPELICTSFHT